MDIIEVPVGHLAKVWYTVGSMVLKGRCTGIYLGILKIQM